MIPDISAIFAQYESLVTETDALFVHVRNTFPHCVICEQGCSDCCHALFDLSLVEAMYLNKKFLETCQHGRKRSDVQSRAADLDRKLVRMKRDFYKLSKDGKSAEDIMHDAALVRVPCPLLDEENSCILYEYRPITCRLYGIPLNIQGKSHVCGKTKFDKGQSYPAVHMHAIQERLDSLSREIALTVKSRFLELPQVFVPVSMALLNRYDETYLGIGPAKKE